MMKKFLKKILAPFRRANEWCQRGILLLLGGSGFANPYFSVGRLWMHFIVQKFFRINSHVPWPVHWTAVVKCPEKIQRGAGCPGIGHGAYLDGRNGIIFGDNVWMACHVRIVSMNHQECNYGSYVHEGPIVIGDDCLLGLGATILPGVELGPHTIVAAGAVVTKSFPQGNVIIGGVPARVIREIPPYDKSAPGRRLTAVAQRLKSLKMENDK